MRRARSSIVAAVLLVLASGARAEAMQARLAACAAIADDRERLACYDALAKGERPTARELLAPQAEVTRTNATAPSVLEQRWELRPELRRGVFRLRPYKPLYGLVHLTSDTNHNPASPTRSLAEEQRIDLDSVEAKMQFSFKTKIAEDVLRSGVDAWFGYTQRSYWQAANTRFSSPFRSTDYEPEVILLRPLEARVAGLRAAYIGLALNHQSNGRTEALSRSWNRVIGELALESSAWSLHLRPWARVFERDDARNDNPDIEDYMGRAELIAVHRANRHVITLTGRHTLRTGDRSRGSLQLDWAFPLIGELNGHVQVFTGYGENLLDYNHRQTSLGLGVSFFD